MNTYDLPKAALAAHLIVAAKKDVRAYLNAVFLDPALGVMVSTDGSAMLITRHDSLRCDGAGTVILPRDALTQALKQSPKHYEVLPLDVNGAALTFRPYEGVSIGAQAMDYTYPTWQRVVPASVDGTAGEYDPALLGRMGDALQALGGTKSQQMVRLFQNGASNAAWTMLDDSVSAPPHVAVIMPCRQRNGMNLEAASTRVAAVLAAVQS